MNSTADTSIHEAVPSPFCGIASDDLTIRVDGTVVQVVKNGCAVTTPAFEAPLGDRNPRIAGQPVTLDAAVAHAAQLLRDTQMPVFSGFGTDVRDTRAALSLIDRTRGVFDQARAESGLRNLLALQDAGWMTTTLGEVKNRTDVLLVVGSDIESAFPRFYERFIWPADTLFGQDVNAREIIYLGRAPSGVATTSPSGRPPQVLDCAQSELPEVIGALTALAKGATLQSTTIAGLPLADLQAVVERLQRAHYGVVTWAAGQWDFPHADLAVQQLCRFIVLLNQTTRCNGLPLGGQTGDRTASQVCAWTTGYPTRVGFLRGYPEYDPYRFALRTLLADGEADALVWVNSMDLDGPPVAAIPTIVIGRCGMVCAQPPEVFIPVGCPGIDHAGHMYRCDNVVALPLYQLRDAGLPMAAHVLQAIEQAL